MSRAHKVTADLLRRLPLPAPAADTDKNSRGTVLIAGASPTSVGAVTLSGVAAFRAGAGKVLLAVPESLRVAIAVGFPEAGIHGFAGTPQGDPDAPAADQIRPLLSLVDSVLIGPGFTNESAAQQLALSLLDTAAGPAFVIDAMSLTGLWNAGNSLRRHHGKLVITPNAGEMARLAGTTKEEISGNPLEFAQQAATRLHCVVVLKGTTTTIAQPQGPSYLHEASIAGLATSGSGDVLAGILAALLARGAAPIDAAIWSVYLHAQAGHCLSDEFGPVGLLARELPAQIPALMRSLAVQPIVT